MNVLHAMGLRGLGQDFSFDPSSFDWGSLNDTSLSDPGATVIDTGANTMSDIIPSETGDITLADLQPSDTSVVPNASDTIFLPDGTQVDNMAGTITTADGTQYDTTGQIVTLPDGTIVDKLNNTVKTPDGITYTNSGKQALIAGILTPDQVTALAVKAAAATGTPVGQWFARTFGGNTVLYRNPTGSGVSTFNMQGLLLPAAIILGIIFLGKGQ